MSDMPTDDVEELEALEIEDDELDEPLLPEPEPEPTSGSGRAARRQARAAATVAPEPESTTRSLEFLHDVEMDVTVELGRAKRTVRDLLEVQVGTVIELDRSAGSPVDVLVNGRLIARGEVVVIDDEFAVRITEIFDVQGNRVSS